MTSSIEGWKEYTEWGVLFPEKDYVVSTRNEQEARGTVELWGSAELKKREVHIEYGPWQQVDDDLG